MKVSNIGSNMTEVETEDYKVLVSYSTPVAYYDKASDSYFKTNLKWSSTTTRHINKWLSNKDIEAKEVCQHILDDLLDK